MKSDSKAIVCRAQSGATGNTSRTAVYAPAIGVTYSNAVPNVAFSNRSVIQQWTGTQPLRTNTAATNIPIAQIECSAFGPSASIIAHPPASNPMNNAM